MNRLQVELDIEGIERMCDHATSGNVSHVIGTIKSYCRMMKEELDVPDWNHYRIQAAIAAMQGTITLLGSIDRYAFADVVVEGYNGEEKTYPKEIAQFAVACSNALVEELKKK